MSERQSPEPDARRSGGMVASMHDPYDMARVSEGACVEAGLSPRWCETLAPILARDLAAHDREVDQAARADELEQAADEYHERAQSHVLATDASRAYRDAWLSASRDARARAAAHRATQASDEGCGA